MYALCIEGEVLRVAAVPVISDMSIGPGCIPDAEFLAALNWYKVSEPPALGHWDKLGPVVWNGTGAEFSIVTMTPEEIIARLASAVEDHLNAWANDYRYRSYNTAMGYVGSIDPAINAEAVAFRDWASLVWRHVGNVETAVLVGERDIPTEPELIAELPVFVPPVV